jgi:hypothetical protein
MRGLILLTAFHFCPTCAMRQQQGAPAPMQVRPRLPPLPPVPALARKGAPPATFAMPASAVQHKRKNSVLQQVRPFGM